MARRRKSSKTRRTKKNRISLTGTAQGLIVANAFVKGASNANLAQFLTGKTSHPTMLDHYQPSTTDSVITLPELLGLDRSQQKVMHQTTGRDYSIGARSVDAGLQLEQMKENVMTNWPSMVGTAIVTPVVFKLGKQVLTKAGVSRGINKVFDVAGLKEVRF